MPWGWWPADPVPASSFILNAGLAVGRGGLHPNYMQGGARGSDGTCAPPVTSPGGAYVVHACSSATTRTQQRVCPSLQKSISANVQAMRLLLLAADWDVRIACVGWLGADMLCPPSVIYFHPYCPSTVHVHNL
jgi:hypothetical protein